MFASLAAVGDFLRVNNWINAAWTISSVDTPRRLASASTRFQMSSRHSNW
ncbi:hypothetical protein [Enhygromyxa salina]|nr:hypothetical protein [Enhygromyxa salina]